MKTYDSFFEDIEQRRAELAQRKKDQMARLKQQSAQGASDTDQLIASNKKGLLKIRQLLMRRNKQL